LAVSPAPEALASTCWAGRSASARSRTSEDAATATDIPLLLVEFDLLHGDCDFRLLGRDPFRLLGTPNVKWWPDRRGLATDAAEFEAESVAWLVCSRFGIDNPSDTYLANYLGSNAEVPNISIDRVMKSAGLIERMGKDRLKPRTDDE
jgi:hypothetical protein